MDKPFAIAIAIDDNIAITSVKLPTNRNDTPIFMHPVEEWAIRGENKIEQVDAAIRSFCKRFYGDLDSVGAIVISSIGLVDMKERRIDRIVRPGWSNPERPWPWEFNVLTEASGGKLQDVLTSHYEGQGCRFTVVNDATAGAVGEFWAMVRERNAKDVRALKKRPFVYVRVGEGVNAGILVKGAPWRGGLHPELGHILPRPHQKDSIWAYPAVGLGAHGVCPVHGACFEGLASKAALRKRWGTDDIKGNKIALEIEANYIAQLCQIATLMLAPGRIVLGGSLIDSDLFVQVREEFYRLIHDYPEYDELNAHSLFLRPATLKRSNLTGAGHLAHSLATGRERAAFRF